MKKFTLWIIFGALLTITAAALVIGSGLFEKKVRGTGRLYVPTEAGVLPAVLATADKMRAYQLIKAYKWNADGTATFDSAFASKLGPDVIAIPAYTEVDIFRVLKDSNIAEIRARWILENSKPVTYIGYVPYHALRETRMDVSR